MVQRIGNIDAIKGFVILLMVTTHDIAWNFTDWKFLTYNVTQLSTGELQASFIWKLVCSFHISLFFLVSDVPAKIVGQREKKIYEYGYLRREDNTHFF